MGKNGVAGLRDFPASLSKRFTGDAIEALRVRLEAMQEVQHMLGNDSPDGLSDRIKDLEREIRFYQQHNWTLHSKVTIWKCPKTERERTNNSGLLHNQLCKDSSASRQGMADFLLVFRKWSEGMDGLNSAKPVNLLENARFDRYIGLEPPAITPQHDSRQYSIEVWRKYASPCWFDVKQERVLNSKTAKENPDENHLCPLQLDVTDRCVELWTNPDDIVFDPFNGLGTSGWSALGMGRNYIGIELKHSYYQTSRRFLLERAASEQIELGAA